MAVENSLRTYVGVKLHVYEMMFFLLEPVYQQLKEMRHMSSAWKDA
jgi:hypothetical protein